jgi:hypothetical protein
MGEKEMAFFASGSSGKVKSVSVSVSCIIVLIFSSDPSDLAQKVIGSFLLFGLVLHRKIDQMNNKKKAPFRFGK